MEVAISSRREVAASSLLASSAFAQYTIGDREEAVTS